MVLDMGQAFINLSKVAPWRNSHSRNDTIDPKCDSWSQPELQRNGNSRKGNCYFWRQFPFWEGMQIITQSLIIIVLTLQLLTFAYLILKNAFN